MVRYILDSLLALGCGEVLRDLYNSEKEVEYVSDKEE